MSMFGSPIPGETPIDDVSGLKIAGITTRAELNIFEAQNIEKVAAKYLTIRPAERSAPFTDEWVFNLHKEMFGEVWDWAGIPRTREVNIGDKSYAIRGNLANLLQDLASWPGFAMDFVEQAARLHHRAVKIHPFPNGNGRWSRMLANIWLKRNRQPLTKWPEKVIGTESAIRAQYLAAIIKADGGDYRDLIALHRNFSEASPSG